MALKIAASIVVCLLIQTMAFGQLDSTMRIEIDTQVWYPFIKAYNSFDAEAYNKIHTADVLRGSPWGLSEGETYRQRNLERFAKSKEAGVSRKISFTFEHRVHQKNIAYEVGYYRVLSQSNGESRTAYGQFHVVLRKENGSWKIAQDWDANTLNGNKIEEADFLKNAASGLYEAP